MTHPDALAWTPEYVARFWDYWSRRTDAGHTYFSQQVGAGVVRFLECAVRLPGAAALDFGAGPGYLVERLLARGARVSAVDYSPETVAQLREKFAGHDGWEGAASFDGGRLPWPDNQFDLVCCLETIEHLLPEHRRLVLQELQRVLKDGGTALITAPNQEDLRDSHVFCPRCSCEFHRWQHVSSWSAATLRDELERLGYRVVFCDGLAFQRLQRKRLFRPLWILWWSVLAASGLIRRGYLPHGSFCPRQLSRRRRDHLTAVALKQPVVRRTAAPTSRPAAA